MSVVIPPGSTIVQTFRKSFTDVPVDEANGGAVATTEFLEAAESLITIFGMTSSFPCICQSDIQCDAASHPFAIDVLGSVAFSPVKSDMLGNIKVGGLLLIPGYDSRIVC